MNFPVLTEPLPSVSAALHTIAAKRLFRPRRIPRVQLRPARRVGRYVGAPTVRCSPFGQVTGPRPRATAVLTDSPPGCRATETDVAAHVVGGPCRAVSGPSCGVPCARLPCRSSALGRRIRPRLGVGHRQQRLVRRLVGDSTLGSVWFMSRASNSCVFSCVPCATSAQHWQPASWP